MIYFINVLVKKGKYLTCDFITIFLLCALEKFKHCLSRNSKLLKYIKTQALPLWLRLSCPSYMSGPSPKVMKIFTLGFPFLQMIFASQEFSYLINNVIFITIPKPFTFLICYIDKKATYGSILLMKSPEQVIHRDTGITVCPGLTREKA